MDIDILPMDVMEGLGMLPDSFVQCCVTSPPYYGLRDYGVEGQIGREAEPDAYVRRMVEVFREVRRVLRDDGTLWLNLGDCYRDKQRMLMPSRVALALQADGWVLRDEIVWHKPRTTPAPVTDRTVAAHEMIYLLSKRERYFYDWAAIEEPAISAGRVVHYTGQQKNSGHENRIYPGSDKAREITVRDTRRSRSVWSFSPQPFRATHFAVMPMDLAERCIVAGSKPGDVVLDPFGGAATTGIAAEKLGRHSVLCELNPEYVAIAEKRIADFRAARMGSASTTDTHPA